MFFTSNIKEFVQVTPLPEIFRLKLYSFKIVAWTSTGRGSSSALNPNRIGRNKTQPQWPQQHFNPIGGNDPNPDGRNNTSP